MSERRITIQIDIDLQKNSKEAHAVTIDRMANRIGVYVDQMFVDWYYKPRRVTVTTTMHYVRHTLTKVIRKPPPFQRKMKVVKSA